MKIKLIAPQMRSGENAMSDESFKLQKLCLPVLAARTPDKHSVKIVDESFGPDDPDEDVDLIGISVLTELALRAYDIAAEYRKRGVKVVMGGIHPTVRPQEVLRHSDSVVIGEGDEVWPRLLADAELGNLQPVYQSDRSVELKGMPIPKRAIYPQPLNNSVVPNAITLESSRGCPYNCEFCTIGTTLGRKYRIRPVPDVIDEIAAIESPYLFFVDDSLALNRENAKRLFTELIPLRKNWIGQGTAGIAADEELLRLMAISGCKGLLVGFESIQQDTQKDMRKITSMKLSFREAMKRFHNYGIAVLGAFIFGFDREDKDVFDRTMEFIIKSRMDAIQLRILTPFPGTELYDRLIREGRLIVPDWWLKGLSSKTLLFHPGNMSIEQFIEGFAGLVRESYSYSSIFTRLFGISPWKRGSIGMQLYMGYNLATRSRYLKNLDDPRPYSGMHPYHCGIPIENKVNL